MIHSSMWCLLYCFRSNGFRGLYKGMEAKLLQTVLTAALMFMVYEKIVAMTFRMMGLEYVKIPGKAWIQTGSKTVRSEIYIEEGSVLKAKLRIWALVYGTKCHLERSSAKHLHHLFRVFLNNVSRNCENIVEKILVWCACTNMLLKSKAKF